MQVPSNVFVSTRCANKLNHARADSLFDRAALGIEGVEVLRAVLLSLLLVGFVAVMPSVAADRIRLDGASAEACFTPGQDCTGVVANSIDGARERVWLMGYGFSERSILSALRGARERGLDVRVILDRSNDNGSYSGATYMAKIGVPVLIDRSVSIAHNKLILIDHDTVVLGSMNWTRAGGTKNAENVHVIRNASELARLHELYFHSREAVSEPYRATISAPQRR